MRELNAQLKLAKSEISTYKKELLAADDMNANMTKKLKKFTKQQSEIAEKHMKFASEQEAFYKY